MNIVHLQQPNTRDNLDRLTQLAGVVFGEVKQNYVSWRLLNMPDISVFIAESNGQWLGFKIGYGMTDRRYYSWLGGVNPDNRHQGIASMLMQAQHEWLQTTAYEVVETHIRQSNHAMFLTNNKFGFRITGRFKKGEEQNLILQRSIH